MRQILNYDIIKTKAGLDKSHWIDSSPPSLLAQAKQ